MMINVKVLSTVLFLMQLQCSLPAMNHPDTTENFQTPLNQHKNLSPALTATTPVATEMTRAEAEQFIKSTHDEFKQPEALRNICIDEQKLTLAIQQLRDDWFFVIQIKSMLHSLTESRLAKPHKKFIKSLISAINNTLYTPPQTEKKITPAFALGPYLLEIINKCIASCCSFYTEDFRDEETAKLFTTTIAQVFNILELYFKPYTDLYLQNRFHGFLSGGSDVLIGLIQMAAKPGATENNQKELLLVFGKDMYAKLFISKRYFPHNGQDRETHDKQYKELQSALTSLEKNLKNEWDI